jgi:hypothetical protein
VSVASSTRQPRRLADQQYWYFQVSEIECRKFGKAGFDMKIRMIFGTCCAYFIELYDAIDMHEIAAV